MTTEQFGRDMFEDFDIDAPEFNDHFTDVLDELVAKCPVAHSTVGEGYHVINRYEDVKAAGQDWQTFSSAKGFQPNRAEGVPYLYPEESDPPYHNSWRSALNPFFAPGPVSDMEDSIRADAKELIASFVNDGKAEFVSQFAAELPGRAFFKNLIGVPVEDLPMILKAMDDHIYGPVDQRAESLGVALGYLGNYLSARKDQPSTGDLIDVIAAGVERDGELCPWEDRVSILTDLTLGGIATTTYVMSGAVHYLATHPEARKKLVDDPDLIPNAVEEFVRYFPPVVALGRSVTKDVEFAGYQFKKDDFVLLNYASASRDPAAIDDPQTVDIERDKILHTAFGVGVHRCIGSHLARLELRIVLEELLSAIPDFSVKEGTVPSYETGVLRTMKSLDLVF
ncbi:cytochrome P450 [Rhodococcoides yunnanense]|uniref:cytochrome P450 n=1 Tax=Rhodococcoides yunnanense TaxID=278209 RepID=UPI0022B13927|nr:cytochrome P450 [Rhodococcus yunnanensis]MCZ4278494.1 cytochrome P450 [Rhodococcus yunnanensis]